MKEGGLTLGSPVRRLMSEHHCSLATCSNQATMLHSLLVLPGSSRVSPWKRHLHLWLHLLWAGLSLVRPIGQAYLYWLLRCQLARKELNDTLIGLAMRDEGKTVGLLLSHLKPTFQLWESLINWMRMLRGKQQTKTLALRGSFPERRDGEWRLEDTWYLDPTVT